MQLARIPTGFILSPPPQLRMIKFAILTALASPNPGQPGPRVLEGYCYRKVWIDYANLFFCRSITKRKTNYIHGFAGDKRVVCRSHRGETDM